MMDALSAAKAYANVQKAAGAASGAAGAGEGLGAGGPAEGVAGAGDFSSMLRSAMTDVLSTTRHAETQMTAQVQGKAELVDVVTAISAAETSLETVMAVRDQVINAYQEIMRMPI